MRAYRILRSDPGLEELHEILSTLVDGGVGPLKAHIGHAMSHHSRIGGHHGAQAFPARRFPHNSGAVDTRASSSGRGMSPRGVHVNQRVPQDQPLVQHLQSGGQGSVL
jgi:hypothetical protein